MLVIDDGKGARTVNETDEQLQKFLENGQFMHFVGMYIRPGVKEWISLLEHTHYIPRTPRNEFFQLRIIEWEDMIWFLVSIPVAERHLAEETAKKCGIRIADGVPTMFHREGVTRFPADNERVFTLENVSGHPVYRSGGVMPEEPVEDGKGETIH